MSTARRIEEFVPGMATVARSEDDNEPKFVGHLLEMPLTNGEEALIDPDEITGVSAHRTESNVTVLRQRTDNYTYFINRPYAVVKSWITAAMKD